MLVKTEESRKPYIFFIQNGPGLTNAKEVTVANSVGGQHAEGQHVEGQHGEGQNSEGQNTEGQNTEGPTNDENVVEVEGPTDYVQQFTFASIATLPNGHRVAKSSMGFGKK